MVEPAPVSRLPPVDANVLFYEWLLSDDCADRLVRYAASAPYDSSRRNAYAATFTNAAAFRSDLARLRTPRVEGESYEEYAARMYVAVHVLQTYLNAISDVVQDFFVSPYEFRFLHDNLGAPALERRLREPPSCSARRTAHARRAHPPARAAGVRTLLYRPGQLYFSLLFGQVLQGSFGRTRTRRRHNLVADFRARGSGGRLVRPLLRCRRSQRRRAADGPTSEQYPRRSPVTRACRGRPTESEVRFWRRFLQRRSARLNSRFQISTISRWAATCLPRSHFHCFQRAVATGASARSAITGWCTGRNMRRTNR